MFVALRLVLDGVVVRKVHVRLGQRHDGRHTAGLLGELRPPVADRAE